MIERLPDQADLSMLRSRPASVVELHRSINDNLISAESWPTQRSEATIVVARVDGDVRLYVHYHLYEDDVGLLYAETEPITRSNFAGLRDAAVESVEAMGFILERIDLRELADKERAELLARLPAFGGRGRQIGQMPGDSTARQAVSDEQAADESVFLLEDSLEEASASSIEMPLPGEDRTSRLRLDLDGEIWEVFLRMTASL